MNRILYCVIISLNLSSCATFNTKIHDSLNQRNTPPEVGIVHTSYLIGDAGNAKMEESTPAIKEMYALIENTKATNSLFFLGDNVYENGIAEAGHKEAELSRHRLQIQIELAKTFAGRSFFIPGNHDWGFGKAAVLRQQELIESQLGDEAFIPDEGCPGPELIELADNLIAIAFDSEWYLGDWPLDKNEYKDCAYNSREALMRAIEDILRRHPQKTVLMVMHHPLFSYGPHGGYYSTKDHLFPLTNLHPAIYLPLPVLGSLAMWIRRNINRHEDLGHERYSEMREDLIEMTSTHEKVIFASGHEHTQQWIKLGKQHSIVSGSGSKIDPARLGKNALFASGKPGFCALDFYKNGEVWIRFYSIEKKGMQAKLVVHAPVFNTAK